MDCRVKTRGTVSEPEAEHYVSILDLMDCRVKTARPVYPGELREYVSILDLMDCRVKTYIIVDVKDEIGLFQSLI